MIRSKKLWLIAPLALASVLNAGNVVADWNAIASTVWLAYSSLAMYDAVNAITGDYEPFYYRIAGPSSASIDAAAAAAAHRILVNYFPLQKTVLDTQFTTYLAAVTGDPDAKTAGVAVGEAAAMAVISARTGDGLEANVTYTPGSGPGAWIPTPPAYAAPSTPWLGQMRPFTMEGASDQLPDPPRALSSEPWSRDYNLTRSYGATNSTVRSAAETEIGLYWTEHTGQQYARVFNNLINNNNLGTEDAARLVAMLWTGAATTLIAGFFGTTRVHVVTDSLAFPDGVHQHVFEDTRDWMDEVFWARMYAGFHFYHSLEAGRQLGETVAQGVARNHFRPVKNHRASGGLQ